MQNPPPLESESEGERFEMGFGNFAGWTAGSIPPDLYQIINLQICTHLELVGLPARGWGGGGGTECEPDKQI